MARAAVPSAVLVVSRPVPGAAALLVSQARTTPCTDRSAQSLVCHVAPARFHYYNIIAFHLLYFISQSSCIVCLGDVNRDQTVCSCPSGHYNLDPQTGFDSIINDNSTIDSSAVVVEPRCEICPEGADCGAYGVTAANMQPSPGWWRVEPGLFGCLYDGLLCVTGHTHTHSHSHPPDPNSDSALAPQFLRCIKPRHAHR